MMSLIRWIGRLFREAWEDGMWVYGPPFVLPGSSPVWRVVPPPRIAPAPAPANDPAHIPVARTDPRIVAARRAGFRLILNPSKA